MYDVIVVGSGTAGLTIANLLANLGLKILLIEKNSHLNPISTAVGVNDECLFAWKSCGIIDQISDYIAYNKSGDVILKYLNENKEEILSLRQSQGISGFPKGVVFLQNKIDEVLLKNLQQKAEVKFEEKLLKIDHDENEVLVTTSKGNYQAKYLIAADGKESTAREVLGIKMIPLSKSKDKWLILNLLTKNRLLEKGFVEVFCGSRSLVSCPVPQNYHRIEISLKEDEYEIIQDENKIRKLIAPYITDFSDYEIVDKLRYRFVTAIAEKYYKNRIALCGDAAHFTSPFASAGLVSGIRDCLVLYDLFKKQNIDFAIYEKLRYKKQLKSLRLAMALEQIMRPNNIIKSFLFTALRLFSKSSMLLKRISLRP